MPNEDSVIRTPRTAVRHLPQRGVYDRALINAILDEALVCHVGIVEDGQPFVMPMLHARVDDRIYIHGSRASRLFRCLCDGGLACVTVTLLDGLVLARSALHHSVNYRSVVVIGVGEEVREREDKLRVLEAVVEQVVEGRWGDVRHPTEGEIDATAIVGFKLDQCSAKVRTGPPVDAEADYGLPVWAGVVPLAFAPGDPEPDPRLADGIPVPGYVTKYERPGGSR
jgi:nitroimidazol reductase NimA-like FMN-containing flavoprotein (pyridoxamine 5'-phosphate oxidase superfamily)